MALPVIDSYYRTLLYFQVLLMTGHLPSDGVCSEEKAGSEIWVQGKKLGWNNVRSL